MTGRMVLAVVAAGVMLTGSAPPLAASSEPTPAAASIHWGRCANPDLRKAGAKCGFLKVPLDYSDPSGSTIKLAVSRLLHTSSDEDYQGIMIVNTGGPGLSGRDNPLIAGNFPSRVASQYDWIGLDPRGVGESVPSLSCISDYFVGPRPAYTPSTPKIAHQWLQRAKDYANACASSPGSELLAHDSTIDWARDLESVRTALGQEQINFYGFSYGTYLGQVYATMFPSHVRRMVLDSNIDPRGDGLHVLLEMAKPNQRNLNFWFKWLSRHDGAYHLGTNADHIRHLFNASERAVTKHPAGGVVGQAEWVDLFFLTGFSNPDWFWSYLGDVFSKWVLHHRAGPLVDGYNYVAEDTTSDAYYATYMAVRCTDSTWPNWQQWRDRTEAVSRKTPFLAWGNSWYMMPCRTWPTTVSGRVDVDGHDVSALLLDDQWDGSIRWSANLAVRDRFPDGSLIEVKHGIAHVDSLVNECEHHYVTQYLASGSLPDRLDGRRADALCSPNPRPTP